MKKSKFFKVASGAAMAAQNDKSFIEKVKAFFAMLSDFRKGNYKPDMKNIVLGLLATLYIISPIDFIPEALLGPFGLIDDLGILLFGMKYFNKEVLKYLSWKSTQQVYADVEDAEIVN
ncbi:YkvA family protein [Empedobacter stercoris]|uniref:YkvA family protein n=1 Tax=Empedobacter stercoris TaxID=1628248 RepID=UPI0039EA28A8